MSNGERVRKYAEALNLRRHSYEDDRIGWMPRIRRVMAVADAEHAELRAEVERLGQRLRENRAQADDLRDEVALLTKARDNWKSSAKGARREFVETQDELEAAARALADERVKVAKATAHLRAVVDLVNPEPLAMHVREARAALAGPEPEATEGGDA